MLAFVSWIRPSGLFLFGINFWNYKSFRYTKYHWGDQDKDEMGGTCGMHGTWDMNITFHSGNLMRRKYLD